MLYQQARHSKMTETVSRILFEAEARISLDDCMDGTEYSHSCHDLTIYGRNQRLCPSRVLRDSTHKYLHTVGIPWKSFVVGVYLRKC